MRHIRECSTCQEDKEEHTHLTGLLQPLHIPKHEWESMSMEFITCLPKVQGKDCIFVVVDGLTSLLISLPFPQIIVHHRWHNYSLERYSGCMCCTRPL
jgi:hypothetical protein